MSSRMALKRKGEATNNKQSYVESTRPYTTQDTTPLVLFLENDFSAARRASVQSKPSLKSSRRERSENELFDVGITLVAE